MPSAITIDKPARTRGQYDTKYFPIAAGETFVPGDHVYLNTDGKLAIAAAAGAAVGNIKLLGIAEGTAAQLLLLTDTTRRLCPVAVPAAEDAEFLVSLTHTTGASAVVAENSMDLPVTLPLKNVGGKWCADVETNGTNDRIVLTERHPKYAHDEPFGWFWARYITEDKLFDSAN